MDEAEYISLVEVGPRDGLQSEATTLSIQDKLDLISCLIKAGLRSIQVTSFVHPKLVDAEALIQNLPPAPAVSFSALVLNRKGLERALHTNLDCLEISVSASSTHSQKNTGMTRQEALENSLPMIEEARSRGFAVRASVQCAFGCAYEGHISPDTVMSMAQVMVQAGANTLALADTTGMGHPISLSALIPLVLDLAVPVGLHLHDTLGLGLVNVFTALEHGVRSFDTSCGGMGGCPMIPDAAGNIATEDTIYFLNTLGYRTGAKWTEVAACTHLLERHLQRTLPAKLRTGGMPPCY